MPLNLPLTAVDYIFGHRAEVKLKTGEILVGVGEYIGEVIINDDGDEDYGVTMFLDDGTVYPLTDDEIESYKILD